MPFYNTRCVFFNPPTGAPEQLPGPAPRLINSDAPEPPDDDALVGRLAPTVAGAVVGQARAPRTIRALWILTGGSPRLLTIVARFGANLSFRALMADLLDLVDDHTEYFKSHLDALPAQERKVYLSLADLWKPANAREIADRSRLGTSKCSAQLARLVDKGAVEVSSGSARRKLYYLTERLYNIKNSHQMAEFPKRFHKKPHKCGIKST